MSSKADKTKDNKEKKSYSPSRKHSSESKDSKRKGKSSKSKESYDKSSKYDSKDSSRREKYKSKYETRKSKERKEKKYNEKGRSNFQDQLIEDQKKCKLPIKRQVKFEEEKKLITQKYFSIADEPIAQALTEEQVQSIRKKLAEQLSSSLPQFCSSEELKHKESLMEGLRRRQNEKEVETKLVEMKAVIPWHQPIEFSNEQKYIWGEESTEIEMHDKRMSTKLRCFYPTVDHIPPEPTFTIINNKYSVKQVQQIQLYTFTPQDVIQDFETQAIAKQQSIEIPIKHMLNLKEPKKSILKKSREQLQKEKEEEQKKQQLLKEQQKKEKEMLKEKKKKEKIAKENAKKLAPETLKKLIGVLQSAGTPTPEQAEELKQIMKQIHDQGIDTQSILQHIKLLKETLLKSTQPPFINPVAFLAPQQKISQQKQNLQSLLGNTNQQSDLKQPIEEENQKINDSLINSGKINQQLVQPEQQQDQKQQFPLQLSQPHQFPIQNVLSTTLPNFRNSQIMPPQINQNYHAQPQQPQQQIQQNQFPAMQKQFNKNYKRVPCTKFHSPQGCNFGERCNFIHDYNYAGIPSPNMYKYVNQKQLKQMNFQEQFENEPQQQQQQPQQQQQQQQNQNFILKSQPQMQQPFQQQQQPQPQFQSQFNFQFKNNLQNQNQYRKPNFYNQNQNFSQQNINFIQQPQNQMPSAPYNNIPFNQRLNGIPNFQNQYQNFNNQNIQNVELKMGSQHDLIGNDHIQEE